MRGTFYGFLLGWKSGSLRCHFWLRCSFGRLGYRMCGLELEKLRQMFMLLFQQFQSSKCLSVVNQHEESADIQD